LVYHAYICMQYCIPYLSNVAISAFEMKKGVKGYLQG
jgi:hypothetical protein